MALLLFCVAYVLPGFIGREPWKNADIAAFGYMAELASGATSWLSPRLLGQLPEFDGLLPYWLGAWAMQAAPAWVAPDFAARIPFMLLLTLALLSTWYGVYFLARSPQAQPLAFAFGGEAEPTDYDDHRCSRHHESRPSRRSSGARHMKFPLSASDRWSILTQLAEVYRWCIKVDRLSDRT